LKQIIIIFFTSFLIFIGCSAKNVKNSSSSIENSKPAWIDNPSDDPRVKGKVFGLGFAKEHIHGIRAQRKMAQASAIAEIARQKGTTVKSLLFRTQATNGKIGINQSLSQSQQGTNTKVSTRIIDDWLDPNTKELYILMVLDE
jgi:hypothetical protein